MKNLKNIWNKKATVFASIEVLRRTGEPDIYNYLLLKRTESSLIVLAKKQGLENISDFSELVKKKIPTVLTIIGSGVLLRKIEAESSLDKKQLITNILPNSEPKEFVLQFAVGDNPKKLFCTLVRKSIIEETCAQFIDSGIFVLDVGIGIFSIASISSLFNTENFKLVSQDYKLILKKMALLISVN